MKFAPHAPVMETEAVAALAAVDHGRYVDATFGGGGYTRAILAAADCTVYGFDRDPSAIER
ncbi:MAG TPA: 16S rRNA (cytosine(1402)-N(4))-methyltransferase, partial [Parvularculaceae bacterium]|nr:16S rRNA (cytosine(1402)-N(4))-methyltransferase [Parvularculaceae bacterium]